jgi:hypothetical protein
MSEKHTPFVVVFGRRLGLLEGRSAKDTSHTQKRRRGKKGHGRGEEKSTLFCLFVCWGGGLTERARKNRQIVVLLSVHRGQTHTPRTQKTKKKKR